MKTAQPRRRHLHASPYLAVVAAVVFFWVGRMSAATPLQIAQEAYLKASNTGANDQFGYAVAVAGDTVVVGACQESSSATGVNGHQNDDSATQSGAAYVFVRRNGRWVQQAYLKASNPSANDQFGYAVAVAGDTIVIGALEEDSSATGVNGNQDDNSATNSGAAYVFVRHGTNWTQQAYLKASNTELEVAAIPAPANPTRSSFAQRLQSIVARAGLAGDRFGSSVAISDDTVLVGAPGEDSSATGVNGNQNDNSATNSGAAYVFVRRGSNWFQQAYLKASNTGGSVALNTAAPPLGTNAVRAIPPRPPPPAPVVSATAVVPAAPGAPRPAVPPPAAGPGVAGASLAPIPAVPGNAPRPAPFPSSGDAFGSSVAISDDTILIGAPGEGSNATSVNGNQNDNSAADAGAAYVFVRRGSNWTQQAYLKASNTGPADRFGQSLAFSGDTVVVAAPGEASRATGVNGDQGDNGAPGSGAAYVFARTGTNWSQQAFLKPANTGMAGQSMPGANTFAERLRRIVSRAISGISVAIAGDTVVVGSRGEDSLATGVNGDQTDHHGTNSGAAYVFVRQGTNWTQHAYLKAHNTDAGDEFGGAVAVAGNLVVIGANAEGGSAIGVNGAPCDNSAIQSGAAYVFDLNASRVPAAALTPPEIAVEQPLGIDLRAGAATVDFGGALVGSSWQQRTFTIRNTGAASLTVLGIAITGANSNDFKVTTQPASYVSGPCGTTLTVNFSPSALGAKIAVLHIASDDRDESLFDITLTGTGVTPMQIAQRAYLQASTTGSNDWFGSSVAVSGDTVVVVARSGATNSGAAVYVFVRNGTTWIQQADLKASNAEVDDRFGLSVALSGDIAVIGAPMEDSNATGVNGNQHDNSGTNSGAAYVFVRQGTNWTQQAYLKASNAEGSAGQFGDWFGVSVGVSAETVVVGAHFEDSNATGVNGNQSDNSAGTSGAAYVFIRDGTNWTQQAYLKASNRTWMFGFAVAISGDTVLVGSHGESSSATGMNGNQTDTGTTQAGAAYVFVRHGTNWSQQAYLKAFNSGPGHRFGNSVAVSGDTAVIAAHREDSNATGVDGNQRDKSVQGSGAAYVFVRHHNIWSQQAYLKAPSAEVRYFGHTVALSGDILAVTTENGVPYLFVRRGTTWIQQPDLSACFVGGRGSAAVSGNTLVVGSHVFDLNADSTTMAGPPEIAVEQPPGSILISGAATVDFGSGPAVPGRFPQPAPASRAIRSDGLGGFGFNPALPRNSGGVRAFTIKNTGLGALTNLAITLAGTHSNEFRVTAQPAASVYGPCGSTTFTVTFTPGDTGARTATLHIANNDPDESPFEIILAGTGAANVQTTYTPYAFTNFAGLPGQPGSADGTSNGAPFSSPSGVAVDGGGNIYVADLSNHTIRKMTPAGAVTTLAGSPGQAGSADGIGSVARFHRPDGVAVDHAGHVYVADQYNHTIRKITPAGVVTTLAGQAGQNGSADGAGSGARFFWPVGVAVDSEGNVYVADSGNHTVRKITPAGVVTTLAGRAGERGNADGAGSSARFGGMETGGCHHDVAVDRMGNVYVADRDNCTIRKITPDGVVTTLAGRAEQRGSTDAIGSAARFNFPVGVAVDGTGSVYVADGHNFSIRRITPNGGVTTLAGTAGQRGAADGIGSGARFGYLAGVAVDRSGNVYVTDRDNNRISKGTPVLAPAAPVQPLVPRAVPTPVIPVQPVPAQPPRTPVPPAAPPPTRPAQVLPPSVQPRATQTGAAAGETIVPRAVAERMAQVQSLFKGKVSLRPDGRFEFLYDFSDPAQLDDWIIREPQAEWSVEGGSLVCKRNASRGGTDTRLYHRALFAGDQREIHYDAQGPHSLAAGLFAELGDWRRQYHFRLDGGRMGHERGGPPAAISAGLADLVTTNLGALDPGHTYRVDAVTDGDSLSLAIDGRMTLQARIPPSNRQSGPMAYLKLAYWAGRFDNVRLVGSLAPAQHELLFADDFQDGLGRWNGGDGGSHSGVIVPDPLSSGRDRVLSFAERTWTGDVFTREVFTNALRVEIRFDYLGLAKPGSVAGDLGGFFGIATGRPESSRFFAGTQDKHPGVVVALVDDGRWHRVNYLYSGEGTSSFRLMIEDFIDSGGIAGDACFDNIQVRTVPAPPIRKP